MEGSPLKRSPYNCWGPLRLLRVGPPVVSAFLLLLRGPHGHYSLTTGQETGRPLSGPVDRPQARSFSLHLVWRPGNNTLPVTEAHAKNNIAMIICGCASFAKLNLAVPCVETVASTLACVLVSFVGIRASCRSCLRLGAIRGRVLGRFGHGYWWVLVGIGGYWHGL